MYEIMNRRTGKVIGTVKASYDPDIFEAINRTILKDFDYRWSLIWKNEFWSA